MKLVLLLLLVCIHNCEPQNELDLTKLDQPTNPGHQNSGHLVGLDIFDLLKDMISPLGPLQKLQHINKQGIMVNSVPNLFDDLFDDSFFKIGPSSSFLRKQKGGKTVTKETTQTMKDGTVVHTIVSHHSDQHTDQHTKHKHKKHSRHKHHQQIKQKQDDDVGQHLADDKQNQYDDKQDQYDNKQDQYGGRYDQYGEHYDKPDVQPQFSQTTSAVQQESSSRSSNIVLYLIIVVLLGLLFMYYRKFQVVNEKNQKINYEIIEQKEN